MIKLVTAAVILGAHNRDGKKRNDMELSAQRAESNRMSLNPIFPAYADKPHSQSSPPESRAVTCQSDW